MSDVKPGLPTEPGCYRLQFKSGHEAILELRDDTWRYLSGEEYYGHNNAVCHLRVEPLQAPEPLGLVERLRKVATEYEPESDCELEREAADEIERLTKERDAAKNKECEWRKIFDAIRKELLELRKKAIVLVELK